MRCQFWMKQAFRRKTAKSTICSKLLLISVLLISSLYVTYFLKCPSYSVTLRAEFMETIVTTKYIIRLFDRKFLKTKVDFEAPAGR